MPKSTKNFSKSNRLPRQAFNQLGKKKTKAKRAEQAPRAPIFPLPEGDENNPKSGNVHTGLTRNGAKTNIDSAAAQASLIRRPVWTGPEVVEFFEGRLNRLDEIKNNFDSHRQVVINGLSGMGKTQLALKYVQDYGSEYDGGFYFVNGANEVALLNGFKSFAQAFNLNTKKLDSKEVIQVVYRLMSNNASKVLLLFDNAQNHPQLQPFLPPSRLANSSTQFYCLVTTVNQTSFVSFKEIRLDWDEPQLCEDLKKYMVNIINRSDSQHPEQEIEKLTSKLRHLPLAVSQAAAYIRSHEISIDEYLKRYDGNESNCQKLLSFSPQESIEQQDTQKVVMNIWLIWLARLTPACRDIIHMCAFLNDNYIARDFFKQQDSLNENSITQLRQYSLVSIQANKNYFHIHELLQRVIRYSVEQQKTAILGQCIQHLAPHLSYGRDDKTKVTHVYYMVQHVERIQEYLEDTTPDNAELWAPLLHQAGWYYWDHEDAIEKSYALFTQALKFTPSQGKEAVDLHLHLGNVTARLKGDKSSRKEYQLQAKRELQTALTLATKNNVGMLKEMEIKLALVKNVIHTQSFYKTDAEHAPLRKEIDEIIKQLKKVPNSTEKEERLAQSYHYLGNSYYFPLKKAEGSKLQELKDKALSYYEQALSIKEDLYGKESVEYIRALKQKAFTLYLAKEYQSALHLLAQCYDFMKKYYAPLILKETAKVIYQQAECLEAVNNRQKACKKYQEYAEISRINPWLQLKCAKKAKNKAIELGHQTITNFLKPALPQKRKSSEGISQKETFQQTLSQPKRRKSANDSLVHQIAAIGQLTAKKINFNQHFHYSQPLTGEASMQASQQATLVDTDMIDVEESVTPRVALSPVQLMAVVTQSNSLGQEEKLALSNFLRRIRGLFEGEDNPSVQWVAEYVCLCITRDSGLYRKGLTGYLKFLAKAPYLEEHHVRGLADILVLAREQDWLTKDQLAQVFHFLKEKSTLYKIADKNLTELYASLSLWRSLLDALAGRGVLLSAEEESAIGRVLEDYNTHFNSKTHKSASGQAMVKLARQSFLRLKSDAPSAGWQAGGYLLSAFKNGALATTTVAGSANNYGIGSIGAIPDILRGLGDLVSAGLVVATAIKREYDKETWYAEFTELQRVLIAAACQNNQDAFITTSQSIAELALKGKNKSLNRALAYSLSEILTQLLESFSTPEYEWLQGHCVSLFDHFLNNKDESLHAFLFSAIARLMKRPTVYGQWIQWSLNYLEHHGRKLEQLAISDELLEAWVTLYRVLGEGQEEEGSHKLTLEREQLARLLTRPLVENQHKRYADKAMLLLCDLERREGEQHADNPISQALTAVCSQHPNVAAQLTQRRIQLAKEHYTPYETPPLMLTAVYLLRQSPQEYGVVARVCQLEALAEEPARPAYAIGHIRNFIACLVVDRGGVQVHAETDEKAHAVRRLIGKKAAQALAKADTQALPGNRPPSQGGFAGSIDNAVVDMFVQGVQINLNDKLVESWIKKRNQVFDRDDVVVSGEPRQDNLEAAVTAPAVSNPVPKWQEYVTSNEAKRQIKIDIDALAELEEQTQQKLLEPIQQVAKGSYGIRSRSNPSFRLYSDDKKTYLTHKQLGKEKQAEVDSEEEDIYKIRFKQSSAVTAFFNKVTEKLASAAPAKEPVKEENNLSPKKT